MTSLSQTHCIILLRSCSNVQVEAQGSPESAVKLRAAAHDSLLYAFLDGGLVPVRLMKVFPDHAEHKAGRLAVLPT